MFKVYQHVLPNARAWRLTIEKRLRQLLNGLGDAADDVRVFYQSIHGDLLPPTTRSLDEWEGQFGLPSTGLSEQQRRRRLDATWKALGGQDPKYIQDTLRVNGFDVYVHEWWEPGTEPVVGVKSCATPRNPLMWLRRSTSPVVSLVDCGEALAQCGEAQAQCGNGLEPPGYPLVNKIVFGAPISLVDCGEEVMECGEPLAECGAYSGFELRQKEYIVPSDPDKWPFFLYIGGETFGTLAQVDPKRRAEFEALCLKICPAQQWLGILVEYV